MITKEDVEHIGWLARIEINEQETVEYMEKLNSVLEYFGQLDKVQPRMLLLHTTLLRSIMYSGRMWRKNASRRKLFLQIPNTNRTGLSGSRKSAEEMF